MLTDDVRDMAIAANRWEAHGRFDMLPLYLADMGEDLIVRKISGAEESMHHIRELGITEGSTIRIISDSDGNLIIQVKESRLAISKELSRKIYV